MSSTGECSAQRTACGRARKASSPCAVPAPPPSALPSQSALEPCRLFLPLTLVSQNAVLASPPPLFFSPCPRPASPSSDDPPSSMSSSLTLPDLDLIITLGGDGTILHVSSLFDTPGKVPPVLSFSMGSLGFLLPFRECLFFGANVGPCAGARGRRYGRHRVGESCAGDDTSGCVSKWSQRQGWGALRPSMEWGPPLPPCPCLDRFRGVAPQYRYELQLKVAILSYRLYSPPRRHRHLSRCNSLVPHRRRRLLVVTSHATQRRGV